MDLFKGLTEKQIVAVQQCPAYVREKRGEVIFEDGDEAYGMFLVLEGSVMVYRTDDRGEAPLAWLEPGSVLGEMGLLAPEGKRTASARAVEDTLLLGIPGEPDAFFERLGDSETARIVLQNLVAVLAGRLRGAQDLLASESRRDTPSPADPATRAGAERDLDDELKAAGLNAKHVAHVHLEPGGALHDEGVPATALYLLRTGAVEAIRAEGSARPAVLARQAAPAILGEGTAFSGSVQTSGIRAAEPCDVTALARAAFTGDDAAACRTLFWVARWAVARIIESQDRALA